MPDAAAHYDKFSRRYDLAAMAIRRFQRQAVEALHLRSWKCHGRWYHPLANWYIDLKAPWVSANPDNEIGACVARSLKEVRYKETMLGVYSIAAGICEG